ncbi:MAG: hypothetical protein JRF59_04895 [Deltaproteobacteria bacterium]|nr:hypothetical protein [Deltaproteobacteria bacterium]MBW2007754.1 hypothetical protein [Deltaproteobacteria bacterium]MBW2347164.1 hypothetical protein [Deltaproteobacteria bacterium]
MSAIGRFQRRSEEIVVEVRRRGSYTKLSEARN